MPLVYSGDFESFPQQPEARWLQLRDLVEKRLDDGFDMKNESHETYDLLEYIQVLSAAAEELGVGALGEISPSNVREEFDTFRASVAALATRLSLRVSLQKIAHSVALARPTRKQIFGEIENLRSTIGNSELSEPEKVKAAKNIDQLQILIMAPRTDLARVELTALTLAALLQALQLLLYAIPANRELGQDYTMSARDREPATGLSDKTARLGPRARPTISRG